MRTWHLVRSGSKTSRNAKHDHGGCASGIQGDASCRLHPDASEGARARHSSGHDEHTPRAKGAAASKGENGKEEG